MGHRCTQIADDPKSVLASRSVAESIGSIEREGFMFHALECRRLLAASIVNAGHAGILPVEGTDGEDVIVLSVTEGELRVSINGAAQNFDFGFSDGEFHRIVITAGNGDDTVTGCDQDEVIYAGAGNDLISGGGGADRMVGGTGND